jgi:hypothetical protein
MDEDRDRFIGRLLATTIFLAGLIVVAFGWDEITSSPTLRPSANALEEVIVTSDFSSLRRHR